MKISLVSFACAVVVVGMTQACGSDGIAPIAEPAPPPPPTCAQCPTLVRPEIGVACPNAAARCSYQSLCGSGIDQYACVDGAWALAARGECSDAGHDAK